MIFRKKEENPDNFWQEYEEKTGEKVLARSLGQYISGLEEYDQQGWTKKWGLLIATSGGFRFHHFPQHSWLDSMINMTGRGGTPKERTFLIPKENIISVNLYKDTKWWKKIFSPTPPQLTIQYRDETGVEHRLILEAEYKSDELIEELCKYIQKE